MPRTYAMNPKMPEPGQAKARKFYDLNGLRIAVSAPSDALAGFWDAFLAPLATAQDLSAPSWNVSIRVDDELPEMPSGEVLYDGELPEKLPVVIARNAGTMILSVPDQLLIVTRSEDKTAEITALKGCETVLRGTASIHAIADIIQSAGQFFLHAACLLDPSSDDALLIFAPSGTGKTTTSLALARAGWRLMGDDVTILNVADGDPKVWALPRWLNVHRNTEALMPWLSEATKPWDTRDEQSVPLVNIASLIHVAQPRPHPCRTLVMLEPPNRQRHELGPIDPSEALLRILSDNLRIAPQGMAEREMNYLDAITTLIGKTQIIRLSVGPDIDSIGRELASACHRKT